MNARIWETHGSSSSRRIVVAMALCACALCASNWAAAQERKMVRIEGGGPIIILPEIMVVVAEEEGKIFVKIELPRRPGAKPDGGPRLAENDVVLRVNGKKIASVAELKKLYEAAKPGDEIKIGAQRGEERFIVSFIKADPKDMPEGMMIKTMAVPADSAGGEKKE